jgi:putative transposon-encoded protein
MGVWMPRRIELNKQGLYLSENEIEGFLERTVTPIGTSAKADIPKRYIGRRVYVIITKEKGTQAKE